MTTKFVDSKGRISLGSHYAGRMVIIDDSNPERIIITPARAIPEAEAWLYENPVALGRVRQGLAEAAAGTCSGTPPDLDADAALVRKLQD
jgi:hypothetical protein